MKFVEAFAKINLGLVVGPVRPDGKHQVVTVLERIGVSDAIVVEASSDPAVVVEGFEDSIARAALIAPAGATELTTAGTCGSTSASCWLPAWGRKLRRGHRAQARERAEPPQLNEELHDLAATIGADVPFFLEDGARLATGDGSELVPSPCLVTFGSSSCCRTEKARSRRRPFTGGSTSGGGASGFEACRDAMVTALDGTLTAADLAALSAERSVPRRSRRARGGCLPCGRERRRPAVYGLFEEVAAAERAARELRSQGTTWLTRTIGRG